MRGLLAALLLSGSTGAGQPHPEAFSSLTISFSSAEISVELRMQERTLAEVPIWYLDTDSDSHVATAELTQAWPIVAAYLARTTWLSLDGQRANLDWSIQEFLELGDPVASGGSRFKQVVAVARLPRPPGLARVEVHSDIFIEEGNLEHRLAVLAQGLWEEPSQVILDYAHRDWTVDLPSTWGALVQYVQLGFHHVLDGWDHLAFLAALLFGVSSLAGLFAAITAFTLAHSITLALAALKVFSLTPAWVEPAIALSVMLVILAHLRAGPARARAWIPAFAFGLLHGFGFAGVLGDIGLPQDARITGLLGFNLGVEAGQLAFVLPLATLAWLARRLLRTAWPGLRRTAGLVVLAFSVDLVGRAIHFFWLPSRFQDPEIWGIALFGATAAAASALLISALVLRGGEPENRLRPLVLQAIVLIAFYSVGASLAGFRA